MSNPGIAGSSNTPARNWGALAGPLWQSQDEISSRNSSPTADTTYWEISSPFAVMPQSWQTTLPHPKLPAVTCEAFTSESQERNGEWGVSSPKQSPKSNKKIAHATTRKLCHARSRDHYLAGVLHAVVTQPPSQGLKKEKYKDPRDVVDAHESDDLGDAPLRGHWTHLNKVLYDSMGHRSRPRWSMGRLLALPKRRQRSKHLMKSEDTYTIDMAADSDCEGSGKTGYRRSGALKRPAHPHRFDDLQVAITVPYAILGCLVWVSSYALSRQGRSEDAHRTVEDLGHH
ncbi:hypothetical protein CPC08DRAFT_750405, partial [Agrocybe pediades]